MTLPKATTKASGSPEVAKRKPKAESKQATPPKKSKSEKEEKEGGKEKEGDKEKEYKVHYNILKELTSKKCDDFPHDNELFTVKYSDSLSAVWKKLLTKGYNSAPVVSEDGFLEGFVDLVHIARFLVDKFGRSMLEGKNYETLTDDIAAELSAWMNKTVRDLNDVASRNVTSLLTYSGYSLMSVFEPMAREIGVHRMAVLESRTSKKLVNLITQSEAIEFLAKHLEHAGSKKYKPIEECIDVIKPSGVYTVTNEKLALEAFEHMLNKHVTAVAVLDAPGGKITGVINIRDLQVLGLECLQLQYLYCNVHAFLKRVAETKPAAEPGSPSSSDSEAKRINKELQPWLCHKGDTLFKVLKQMQKHKASQLFLVDENSHPIGVVSKEVLLEFLS